MNIPTYPYFYLLLNTYLFTATKKMYDKTADMISGNNKTQASVLLDVG